MANSRNVSEFLLDAGIIAATRPEDMNRPGWDWHPLKGGHFGHCSVSVNGNWRRTFAFENGDAILADYQDYH